MPPQSKGVRLQLQNRCTFAAQSKRYTRQPRKSMHLCGFGQKVYPDERKSGTPLRFRAKGVCRPMEIRYTFWHDSPQARRHAEPRHQRARPAIAGPFSIESSLPSSFLFSSVVLCVAMNATSTYVRIVLGIVSSVVCSDVSSCGARRDRDFASCEEGESGGREDCLSARVLQRPPPKRRALSERMSRGVVRRESRRLERPLGSFYSLSSSMQSTNCEL